MRPLLLIAVPLLLAVVLWSLLGGDETPQPLLPESPQADATAVDQARGAAAPVDAASRTSTESLPSVPVVPADALRITFTVVEQGTGRPVALADVAWSDSLTAQRLGALPADEAQALLNDPERMAHRLGWQARTDQQGLVHVHVGTGVTTVFAREGNRYGSVGFQGYTPPPPQGHRLELRDDSTLLVQVLDRSGAAVTGVPVWVAGHRADGTFVRWLARGWLPRTDAEGKTQLLHLQEQSWDEGTDPAATVAEWRVRTRVPTVDDRGIAFDPKAPPTEPIVLRLPPVGSVEARVTLHGKPVAANWMSLNKAGLTGAAFLDTCWQQLPDREGRFLFPCLPLNVTWSIMAGPRGGSVLAKEFAGPTAEQSHMLLDIPVPDDHVVITGRCLDVAGQPVADSTLEVEFLGTIHGSPTKVPTGGDGRFQWFAGSTYGRPASLERAVFRLARAGDLTLQATLRQRELRAGFNEVGDLRLGAGEVIVTGRFVTEGAPGKLPRVGVERLQAGPTREQPDAWSLAHELTSSELEGGRFEVHGDTTPVPHRLTFFYSEHLPLAPVEFRPGARDLEIRLTRGHALSATVLLPASVPKGVEAELRPEGERWPVADAWGYRRYLVEPDAKGGERHGLQWRLLPPGSYTLAFTIRGGKDVLLAIDGVQVPQPAEGDARLQDIDLRGLVSVLTVRVPEPEGKPDPFRGSIMLFLQPQAAADTWLGFQYGKDELRMPVPRRPVDLLVVRTGQRPKLVSGAQGEVTVTFDPWPELSIVVPALAVLPAGIVAMAYLQPADQAPPGRYDLRNQVGERNWFRAPGLPVVLREGTAGLPIGEGAYRLHLQLSVPLSKYRTLPLKDVSPIEVVAGSGPLEISVPADQVRQAIEKLQK